MATKCGYLVLVWLLVAASVAEAEVPVRFYVNEGKEAATVDAGSVDAGTTTELVAKAKISKQARAKKFDQMYIELKAKNMALWVTIEEVPKLFEKRFKGDEITLRIAPSSGQQADVVESDGTILTMDTLVKRAITAKATEGVLTLTISGSRVTGYKKKMVYREGSKDWVQEKEPIWDTTYLARGTFTITNVVIPVDEKAVKEAKAQALYDEAKTAYRAGDYRKALDTAKRAVEAGKNAGDIAVMAACNLKDKDAAAAAYAKLGPKDKQSAKLVCSRLGVSLEP